MMSKATQDVIVCLSNGVKGVFTGRAIAWPGKMDDVTVTDVQFTVPAIRSAKAKKEPVTDPKSA